MEWSQVGDGPCYQNVELETKFIVKYLVFSDKDEIISGLFIMKGIDSLPLLKIVLVYFQYSWDPSFFSFGSDCLYLPTLGIFWDSLAVIDAKHFCFDFLFILLLMCSICEIMALHNFLSNV